LVIFSLEILSNGVIREPAGLQEAVELIVYIENSVRNFPRYHKYTISADLRDLSRRLIINANSIRGKDPVLTELRDKSEELKLMITIGVQAERYSKLFGLKPGGKGILFLWNKEACHNRKTGIRRR